MIGTHQKRRTIMAQITCPTPHIQAKVGEIAETILLPGDPLRAKFIADTYLENVKQFNSIRNMFGFTGTYQGKPVSVMGTGMGCPSMGIYSFELMNIYGCKNLIRIGTAGTLQPEVHVKEMVFGQASCTTSNYVNMMGLPGTFAPICSFELLEKAVASAKKLGYTYHVGNILSSDVFYGVDLPHGKTWAEMGVLAVEMESAALYTNAAAAGANALCILTISDGPDEITTAEERQTAFTQMMEVALSLA
jgi:purine-nucleoside phosphorylase